MILDYPKSHHNDSNPTPHVSHHGYWGLFFRDEYYITE